MNQDWLFQIALGKIPGVGGVIARNLVSYCGGTREVFNQSKGRLMKIPGVGPRIAESIRQEQVLREAEAELKYIEKHDIRCVFYLDPDYPERLKPYVQSPVLLYVTGQVDLNAERTVAVVGTRKPTAYGKARCEQIIADLKQYTPVILSGLAYGVDIAAHRAAIRNGLSTVAVMGSGLGFIYPRAHTNVVRQMLEHGGLITEFGFKTGPDRENFPARNRIVAAMADALVVIESGRSGGSMITAEFADIFHKDIFALPGRVGDAESEGCNHLIKAQKAHLIEGGEDLAGIMRWSADGPTPATQRRMFEEMSETEQLLVSALEGSESRDIDALAERTKLPMSELASVLLSLEFKGVIKPLPGKRYIIIS